MREGDAILIHGKTPAVICELRGGDPPVAEAIYRHASGRIVAEDVVFANGEWAFRNFGSCSSVSVGLDERYRAFAERLDRAAD
jgi:hypothetical protein